MVEIDIDHLRNWIGNTRTVKDIITPRLADSFNAIFDIDADPTGKAPLGCHWCLAPDIAPMRGLGVDGHPARGGFLPPVPFPRRMWAGGKLKFYGDFRVGDEVARQSTIEDVVMKTGRSGDMVFVAVRHRYMTGRGVALDEQQDIVYRKLEGGVAAAPAPSQPVAVTAAHQQRIDASPVLLFRYSAITFNGHRIHYDQPYVTGEEGYPGLIFHGPLQATYLLRLATELNGNIMPSEFEFRSVSPLFSGGEISIGADATSDGYSLHVYDQTGRPTMDALSHSAKRADQE